MLGADKAPKEKCVRSPLCKCKAAAVLRGTSQRCKVVQEHSRCLRSKGASCKRPSLTSAKYSAICCVYARYALRRALDIFASSREREAFTLLLNSLCPGSAAARSTELRRPRFDRAPAAVDGMSVAQHPSCVLGLALLLHGLAAPSPSAAVVESSGMLACSVCPPTSTFGVHACLYLFTHMQVCRDSAGFAAHG